MIYILTPYSEEDCLIQGAGVFKSSSKGEFESKVFSHPLSVIVRGKLSHYVDSKPSINSLRSKFRCLSNMFPCKFEYLGIEYRSSEAAYQASKTNSIFDKVRISKLSGSEAKKVGRQIPAILDWNSIEYRIETMESILLSKFSSDDNLKDFLLSTGNLKITEGNNWGDLIWGIDLLSGEGNNLMGKSLMKVRDQLR